VTQRWIEVVIGRLVTDEALRRRFLTNAPQTITELLDEGIDLTRSEIAALIAIDTTLWTRVADQVNPTLLAAGLKHE